MYSNSWGKLIAVSSALAAAGLLACSAALLDVLIPGASPVEFLTRVALLGVAVTAVVIGYTWACDKWGGQFNGRLDRRIRIGKLDRNAASGPEAMVSRPEPKDTPDRVPAPDALQPPMFHGRYALTYRGTALPMDATSATTARAWRGQ
jgi:hypothetical protein